MAMGGKGRFGKGKGKLNDKNKRRSNALFRRKKFCRFTAEKITQIDYKDIALLKDFINENGKLKVYGAGILSSSGETVYSIDDSHPKRIPYDIKNIFNTPYIKDKFQEQYFVIDSYEQLYNSIPEIAMLLEQEILTPTN